MFLCCDENETLRRRIKKVEEDSDLLRYLVRKLLSVLEYTIKSVQDLERRLSLVQNDQITR